MEAKFLEMKAAADFLGNGAIEINRYENEITDMVRRESVALNRIRKIPATGHPHRYFEQTAVATAAFTDPRNISPTPSGPTRVERSAFIKAITAQTNLSLFDVDVTRMQGQFAYLEAKDIADLVSGVVRLQAANIWNGNDTSLTSPSTAQYMGLLSQISLQATIGPGASIIDGLKAQVASMIANTSFTVRPSAIVLNPVLGDYVDREAKAQKIDVGTVTIDAGVQVKALQTQGGLLPLVPEPFVPTDTGANYGFGAPPTGYKNYYAVIEMESEIEMPVVHGGDGNLNPRIFQLGLLAGLQGQYVCVKFDHIIAKGPSYAHAVVCIQRP